MKDWDVTLSAEWVLQAVNAHRSAEQKPSSRPAGSLEGFREEVGFGQAWRMGRIQGEGLHSRGSVA